MVKNREIQKEISSAKIILFTNNFPFKSGEEFLRSEITYIINNNIKLFIISYGKINKNLNPGSLNVKAISIDKNYYYRGIIRAILSLFSFEVFKEIRFASKFIDSFKFNKKDILSIMQYKFVYYRMSHFMKVNQIDFTNKTIYTYWTGAIAYFFVKNKKLKKNFKVSRAHASEIYLNRFYSPFRREIFSNLDRIFFSSELGRKINVDFFQKVDHRLIYKMEISRLGTEKVSNEPLLIAKKKITRILSVSSINYNKRLDLIVNSLALLDYPLEWIHIGDGNLIDVIIKLASEKLSGKVDFIFKGYLNNQEVIDFMLEGNIDYFINLSDSEGIPVSIIEAMSCGIPCIARNIGAISEIIDNNFNGLLIDSDCSKEISINIKSLLEISEKNQNEMRINAYRTWSKLYSSEVNYSLFYDQLMNNSK